MNSQSYRQSASPQTLNQAKQQPLKNQSIPLNNKQQMKLLVEKAEEENEILLEKIETLKQEFKQYTVLLRPPVNASKHLQYRDAYRKVQRQILELQNELTKNRQLIKDWENGIQCELKYQKSQFQSSNQQMQSFQPCKSESMFQIRRVSLQKKIEIQSI